MILFVSNPGEDYQDSIFYAFKKTYGDQVVTYPDKPIYYETEEHYRNCHYTFKRTSVTKQDIIDANKHGGLKAVFIISSGYRVWPDWEELRTELYKDGKKFPVVIIDGADGDRLQYSPEDYDLYFSREMHHGPTKHDAKEYPRFQLDYIKQYNMPGPRVYPLPFSIIPEKFPPLPDGGYNPPSSYRRDVFFRGAFGKQRAKYLEGIDISNSLIDIHSHTPIHLQDRQAFFSLIQTSKINLNITAGGNDCMRFWELLGAGGFILTEAHNQITEPRFINRVHLDRFSSREEMLDKISFYTKHESIRERIRQQGYNFAMKYHTCYARMHYILDKCKELGYNVI